MKIEEGDNVRKFEINKKISLEKNIYYYNNNKYTHEFVSILTHYGLYIQAILSTKNTNSKFD